MSSRTQAACRTIFASFHFKQLKEHWPVACMTPYRGNAMQTSARRLLWTPVTARKPCTGIRAPAGRARASATCSTRLAASDLLAKVQTVSGSPAGLDGAKTPPHEAELRSVEGVLKASVDFKSKCGSGPMILHAAGYDWFFEISFSEDKDKGRPWRASVKSDAPPYERTGFEMKFSLQDSAGNIIQTHDNVCIKNCTANQPSCSWSFSDPELQDTFSLCVVIKAPAPAASCDGDVRLVLDSGERFPVHSLLLRWCSDIFVEALAANSSGGALLLPGVSGQQMILFLHMLYSTYDSQGWLKAKSFSELQQLAAMCYLLACNQLLGHVDRALAEKAASNMTSENAQEVYVQAQLLELTSLQQKSTQILFRQLPHLKLASRGTVSREDQLVLPLLREAQRLQKESAGNLTRLMENLDVLWVDWDEDDDPDDDDVNHAAVRKGRILVQKEQERYQAASK